ncbi:MAG TPA: nuclear transport factor 2 family protein [Gaiellaceae bacterium]|nr:nuclear transport factor 2 family protein [Gaiellaceae bacterium]
MIGTSAVVEDEAIAGVLRLYIEGAANGDAAKLKEAFHEHARTFGSLNGTRYDISAAEMIELEERSPRNSDGKYTANIMSIDQAGDVATATVEEDGCWGTASFTSFLTLAKIDGRWQIVNKVFAHVSGALPS